MISTVFEPNFFYVHVYSASIKKKNTYGVYEEKRRKRANDADELSHGPREKP